MPKIVNHDEYREELIWSCFTTFADKGYSRCTIKELAAGAGVTSGTLYHYFESKRKLFESMVRTMAEADLESLEKALASETGTRQRLMALAHYFDVHEDYLARQVRIWTELLQLEDFDHSTIEDLYVRYRELLHSILAPSKLQEDAQEHAVTMLAAMLDGLVLHRQFDRRLPDFPTVLSTLADLVQSLEDS